MILVSPSEPAAIKAALRSARVHPLPEKYGADFLVVAGGQRLAIQRKTVDDFLASLEDGRLAREILLLRRAPLALLVLEGRVEATVEGNIITPYRSRYTREQLRNALRSLQLVHGVALEYTDSEEDTAVAVVEIERWLRKGSHRGLLRRPKTAAQDDWGGRHDREWAIFLLQGFPGIGPALAGEIYDAFGAIPLRWACSFEDLLRVPGIGPKRARVLWDSLELPLRGG